MIECLDISYSIDRFEILKNISLSWQKAGCYSILGPNGAGKTTLLRGLGGLNHLNQGHVLWYGRQVDLIPIEERSRIVAFQPQWNTCSNELTVWELMNFARFPHMSFFRVLNEEERKFGESLLSALGLLDFKYRKLDSLSGGELQKVHLICCLFQEPKILFLDEPLSSLDTHFQEEVCAFLKNWSQLNQTQVIMVSHHLNLALLWSDEVVFLDKGELCFIGEPNDLAESGLIEEFYQGCMIKIQRERKTLFLPRGKW